VYRCGRGIFNIGVGVYRQIGRYICIINRGIGVLDV
jgi:hypothetical protein